MGGGRGRRSGVDRREEVLSHIRIEADRLEAEGVPPEEALRRARKRFGEAPELRARHTTPAGGLDALARDARLALRQLRAAPLTTATILLSLALGIGAATAIFSLADQVMVRALPVQEPERVVQLRWDGHWVGTGRGFGSLLPHQLYRDLKEEQDAFAAVAARSPGEVSLEGPGGAAERVQVELVTGGYFDMLGVRPHLGRLVDEGDDRILGGHPVVVLSHAYWRSRFGADPEVVGSRVRVNGRPMTVVGVAPPGFHGTDWSVVPGAWLPMTMNPVVHDWGRLEERRVRFQHVFARLAPGVGRAAAEAALQPWFRRYVRTDMERPDWPAGVPEAEVAAYLDSRLAVDPGGQGEAARAESITTPLVILTAATGLLLLLACLNVANLSLARAVARYRETAVRRALGAPRRRVVTERLVESAITAAVGGALGVLAAPAAGRWILSYLDTGDTAMALSADLDGRALLTALAVATLATLLSGVGPAWFAASARPMGALRTRTEGPSGALGLRKALVVGQVGLALVFLTGSGLFGRTLEALRSRGPGFPTDRLVTFRLAPADEGYGDAEARAVLERVVERVGALPEVSAAAVAAWPLLEGGGWGNPVLVEGRERLITEVSLPMNAVSPGYFRTLGIPVTRGRAFDSRDRAEGTGWGIRAAVVSESFVERWLPGQDPLGVLIDFGTEPSREARIEVVGVVADHREHQLRETRPQVYFPLWQRGAGEGTFYLRTRAPLAVVAPAVRAAVGEVGRSLTVTALRSMDQQVDRLLAFERMLVGLGRAFAAVGTLLAMVGVYGVMSFAAQARRRDVGIRLALGAPRAAAWRGVVGEAAALAGLGALLALPAIWWAGGLVRSQLYGVRPLEPGILLGAAALLAAVCVVASAVPAWRSARTDPLDALRAE